MKKVEKIWGRLVFCLASAIMCSLFVFGIDAQAASLRGNNNEEKIFYYLMQDMSFNNAGAAGVLANIERESSFNPNALGDNGTSFGICQWHAARYEGLKRFCSREGYDYKSLEGQLDFLKEELTSSSSYYTSRVLNPILAVKNSKKGAYDAAYIWCYYFEIPADRENRADQRGNLAKKVYWPRYKDIIISLIPGQEYKTESGTYVAIDKKSVSFKAVADKKATKLSIPNTVMIGDIKAKVVGIEAKACKKNKKLTEVTIGKNVKYIGKDAFNGCKKLETVKIKSTKITSIEEGSFLKIGSKCKFYMSNSVKKKYKKMLKETAPSDIKIKKLS